LAIAAYGGRVVLFGGSTDTDLYVDEGWILRTKKWHQVTAEPTPAERAAAGLAYDTVRKQAVLFGGVAPVDEGSPFLADTWLLQR